MMADTRSSLKILFQGETSLISCESSSTYEEVISQAMSRFAIPETQRKALILTNGKDYVFEAHLLEYFLLLFPSPEITFHLKFDWSKMRRSLGQTDSLKRKCLVDSEQTEGQKEEDQEKEDSVLQYKPVPVYRMNCFLGSLPTAGAMPVHRQNCFLREQSQQQLDEISVPRLQADDDQQKEPPMKRLRVDVCAKPRRTASTSVGPSPVPVMRSIRI
ncbi:uncharacterized protein LOC6525325 [Drosophila yakuba]|uniref:Uncharacterized protein n=1 Tax=Drosophila yakuba TaxID=7245 RepID=B4Q0D2_DROYA|nr:uncharacterized protein LOC6525325 [Drosophila yakuba]EDX02269.2 uncharacterized protein Dyak_GE17464 [Drosophila yakuba]